MRRFSPAVFRAFLVVCLASAAAGPLRAGSDPVPVAGSGQNVPSLAMRMGDYLKAQRVEHTVETSPGGDITVVKVYDVTSTPRQDAICAGLSVDGKRDRLQGVTVQFLTTQTGSEVVQNYQPSGLPSGNGTVTSTQRTSEKTNYKLLRTVKLQEVAAK